MAIKDKDILWFIPLSSKIDKHKAIIKKKVEKYGSCKTIMIKKIAGQEQVILIQHAFPTLDKYVKSRHTIDGKVVKIPEAIKKEIVDNFKYMLILKNNRGLNLFFTDIDKNKEIMLQEIN